MNALITKSEFFRRIRMASHIYRDRLARDRTIGSAAMNKLASDAAEDSRLPAKNDPSDPVTDAVLEIGAHGIDAMKVMILAESAWEHLLHDKDANVAFKKLNP